MSLLRIQASLLTPSGQCQWALVSDTAETRIGCCELSQLPRGSHRVALVFPATHVLILRVRLPGTARRASSDVLAYAVEDQLAGEPEANHVVWLGRNGDDDVLAVIDQSALQRWRESLAAIGIHHFEWHCDGLLLPWLAGEWSLAWDGREGVLRSAQRVATCTDLGDASTPPLAVRVMLGHAQSNGVHPDTLMLYPETAGALPDLAKWSEVLGIDVRDGGVWNWRHAPESAGVCLGQERRRWQLWTDTGKRLRTAAAITGVALVLHAVALLADWRALANEQQALSQRMEARFRSSFPDAVAVVDPALQMQRKLAEARHAAGHADTGDFLPMIEPVALALAGLPTGSVRQLSFSQGQLVLTLSALPVEPLETMLARLRQAGLSIEISSASANGNAVILTVRTS